MNNKFDTMIIGAGAAGLMCAYTAAKRGKKVVILDHSQKLAEKIRISGGGRCNFTNIYTEPKCYISQNPHFCISPLSRYTPNHFTELLDKYNITYHEKTLGQLFCNHNAKDIIDLFDYLSQEYNVVRYMGIKIKNVTKLIHGFEILTSLGEFISETLVIATGGLSIPQIGASDFGYNVARQFKLPIIQTMPALVPLTLSTEDLKHFTPLSGTSFFSDVIIGKQSFSENTLITHRGLSGPAILQISSYWEHGLSIKVNMLPQHNIESLLQENRNSNKMLSTFLSSFFSERLANSICQIINLDKQLSQLSNKEITQIKLFIHGFKLTPNGTLGYKKAEVTRGGVDTRAISSKTMMANLVDGLFFIGEVVDVTGWLGGYNFQWAWASAHVTGLSI